MRKQRVVLEHEADASARAPGAAMPRRRVEPGLAADVDAPALRRVDARDRAQDRRLAAARRARPARASRRARSRASTSSGIGRSCASATRRRVSRHGACCRAMARRRQERDADGDDRQQRAAPPTSSPRPAMSKRLHAVVDRDRDRLRLAGNAAADHQHDAEFAQRVRERQHHRGQEARPRQRQLDPPQALRMRSGRSTRPHARRSSGIASNARCSGWIANGRLKITDATQRARRSVNTSGWPISRFVPAAERRAAARAPPAGSSRAPSAAARAAARTPPRRSGLPAKSRAARKRARRRCPTRQRGSPRSARRACSDSSERGAVHRGSLARQREAVAREHRARGRLLQIARRTRARSPPRASCSTIRCAQRLVHALAGSAT